MAVLAGVFASSFLVLVCVVFKFPSLHIQMQWSEIVLACIGGVYAALAVCAVARALWLRVAAAGGGRRSPLQRRGAHIVISGASTGLGFAIAARAKRAGMRVTIMSQNATRLEAARAELETLGDEYPVHAAAVNVCDADAVAAALNAAIAAHGTCAQCVCVRAGW